MKKKAFFSLFMRDLIVLLLIIFAAGCASSRSVAPLRNDKLSTELGFNTILIIDLEIQDYSSSLQSYGKPSLWEFFRGNTQSENRMTQYIIPRVWKQSNNNHILHQTIDLETIAGTHKISTISFTFDNKIYAYKIFRQFELLPGSINYLGKIKLLINKNGSYQTNVDIDESSRQESFLKFKKKNPSLYKKYEDNIKIVQTEIFTKVAW